MEIGHIQTEDQGDSSCKGNTKLRQNARAILHPDRPIQSQDSSLELGVVADENESKPILEKCFSFQSNMELGARPSFSSLDYEEETRSLRWHSTYEPFVSASFLSRAMESDLSAFDSSFSVNTIASEPLPGNGRRSRLAKGAAAVFDFGRSVLPRLKRQTGQSRNLKETNQPEKPCDRSRSRTMTYSTDNHTRSNTLDSMQSFSSLHSRSSVDYPADISSVLELKRTSSWFPAHILRHARSSSSLGSAATCPPTFTSQHRVGSASASPRSSKFLSTLPERDFTMAPQICAQPQKLTSPYNGTDARLESLMQQMQEEDKAFQVVEESMRSSGWSSQQEIQELQMRRVEQQNIWKRQLDDAIDAIKAEIEL